MMADYHSTGLKLLSQQQGLSRCAGKALPFPDNTHCLQPPINPTAAMGASGTGFQPLRRTYCTLGTSACPCQCRPCGQLVQKVLPAGRCMKLMTTPQQTTANCTSHAHNNENHGLPQSAEQARQFLKPFGANSLHSPMASYFPGSFGKIFAFVPRAD
ncbi:hypothetical protein EJ06DRAFT_39654 [Trichodelitschia bisporula]|uniref:Uncharacterized protein n=1 Tax=Trichodelitschia bisporula TaxID=703511 RepID=A0A6G1HVI9_9PEZI|nr:hypothetical protein EJ06DRAFT_39654 [Trichodelitschia bisporula]